MDALGDIKQLMVMEKRLAQAIEKVVNPPMVADAVLRNEPATLIPGGVTYIPQGAQNVGFKPAYEIKPDIPAMVNAIAKVEGRIKATFFEDLFLMISQLDTVRTATEIAERKEEKMLMLGPALERLHDELLRPAIERTWEIMQRNRLLPPPPPALAPGQFVAVEFISTLAQAQKAVATAAIERVFGFAGNIAAIKPDIMDSLDADEALREYSDMVGAPPKIVVDPRKVAQLRAARAQQQQQQLALQSGLAAAQGAKTLADTDVGGGMNALQRMTGLAA